MLLSYQCLNAVYKQWIIDLLSLLGKILTMVRLVKYPILQYVYMFPLVTPVSNLLHTLEFILANSNRKLKIRACKILSDIEQVISMNYISNALKSILCADKAKN